MTSQPAGGGQSGDKMFASSVAQIYETHMVPLIFQPYAADLVSPSCPETSSR